MCVYLVTHLEALRISTYLPSGESLTVGLPHQGWMTQANAALVCGSLLAALNVIPSGVRSKMYAAGRSMRAQSNNTIRVSLKLRVPARRGFLNNRCV